MKTCISCGMPLQKAADHPRGDTGTDWCLHCARPDGSLKSYGEALEGMSSFIQRTQGYSDGAARALAARMMAAQPAWKDHPLPG
jgi:hypothetical protein